jgi:hypothetical protein
LHRAGGDADCRHVYTDTSSVDLTATVAQVTEAIPEMFRGKLVPRV